MYMYNDKWWWWWWWWCIILMSKCQRIMTIIIIIITIVLMMIAVLRRVALRMCMVCLHLSHSIRGSSSRSIRMSRSRSRSNSFTLTLTTRHFISVHVTADLPLPEAPKPLSLSLSLTHTHSLRHDCKHTKPRIQYCYHENDHFHNAHPQRSSLCVVCLTFHIQKCPVRLVRGILRCMFRGIICVRQSQRCIMRVRMKGTYF